MRNECQVSLCCKLARKAQTTESTSRSLDDQLGAGNGKKRHAGLKSTTEGIGRHMQNRSRVNELMDDPALDPTLHATALKALGRINRISRTFQRVTAAIQASTRGAGPGPLKILDIASGGGDLALGLSQFAKRNRLQWEVSGADISPYAVEHSSRKAQAAGLDTRFFPLDAVNQHPPEAYDVVMCSLFLHHLSNEDAGKLLKNMAASARRLVLIDDLLRSHAGYWLAWLGCRLLTRSYIVHHDGPASVKSAFQLDEVAQLANQCGLMNHKIVRHWPERFMMTWSPQ
jgi:2-polyprenyl-3-methyl-5-hydroxy-6-metoxy-1,4-benzoquinol methylase